MKRARGVAVLLALIESAFLRGAFCGELQIHFIDVGQGSSELIIGPGGTSILIDGGTSARGTSDVLPYLNAIPSLGRRLDYVICSHDHNDHYGGLVSVLGSYTAGAIRHCGLNTGFGRGTPLLVGEVIDLGDGASATCVAANGSFIDGAYVAPTSDKNTRSIALLVEYGDFDYLTAGDMPGTREDELAGALVDFVNAPGHPRHPGEPFLDAETGVDVLHANHHGSKTSSTATYVNMLTPEVALINAGTSYSHPTQHAVDRLLGRETYTACSSGSAGQPTGVTVPGAAVYRTTASGQSCPCALEEDCPSIGDILITTDGDSGYTVEASLLDPVRRRFDDALLDDDLDDDGLTDEAEEETWFTDPDAADTDSDGFTDFMEAMCGGDPNDAGSTPVLRVDFQPATAGRPAGAMPATGGAWSDGAGFGWVM